MKRKYEADVHQAVVEPTNERIAELARLGDEIDWGKPTPFYIKWIQNFFILLFMITVNIPVLLIKLIIFLVGAIVMGIGKLLFMAGGYVVFFFRIIIFAGVFMGILILCKAMDTTGMPWFLIPLVLGIGMLGSFFTVMVCQAVYSFGDTVKDFGWGMPFVKIRFR